MSAYIYHGLIEELPTGGAAAVGEDSWHQGWSEPKWTKKAAGLAVALIASGGTFVNPVPTAKFIDKLEWTTIWAEPVWIKEKSKLIRGLPAQYQQFTTFTNPVPTARFIDKLEWTVVWTEPVRRRPFNTALQPAPSFIFTPSGETITVDKWFDPFADPVRQRAGLGAPSQQFLAHAPQPFAADYGYFGWFGNLGERPRSRSALNYADYQPFVFAATAETITLDKWLYALSEPVRTKLGLLAGLQQPFTADTSVIPISSLMPWYPALSEPVRYRQFQTAQQPFTAFNPQPFVSFGWPQLLSEPVRQKVGLGAQLQQWLAHDPQPFTADYGYFAWYANLRDPTRRPSSLHVYPSTFNVALAFAETVTLDKWLYGLSEPVRTRFLATAQQPFTAFGRPPLVSFGWYEWFGEPVRLKPGLRANFQQFTAQDTSFIPTPAKIFAGWFENLSEPVRLKIGLSARLQVTYASAIFPPPVVPITYTLSVTETGDVGFLNFSVFHGRGRAKVSIVELVPQYANWSIKDP